MPKIDRLLKMVIEQKASDLHLPCGSKPYLRVDGEMELLEDEPAGTPQMLMEIFQEIAPDKSKREFETDWDTDFAYQLEDLARFRINFFVDRHGPGAVFRLIPLEILTADDLKLSKTIRKLTTLPKGLILVTGPTGSGKSTTLAAMLDLINKARTQHIITIEDPIEYVHPNQGCLINQREVHSHTKGFMKALRAALREDPDIVLLGEMRDLETIETAIITAETGHLVFATLHTTTAAATVDRIIDQFEGSKQNQIRAMLSTTLRAVIAQTLCKRADGRGRVAAMEILIGTPAINSLIREGKTYQIPSIMQAGGRYGMQLLNASLADLVRRKVITLAEALERSADREDLERNIKAYIAGLSPRPAGDRPGAPAARPREEIATRPGKLKSAAQATSEVVQVKDELPEPSMDEFEAFRERVQSRKKR
jgi:twitching motility protein PilT